MALEVSPRRDGARPEDIQSAFPVPYLTGQSQNEADFTLGALRVKDEFLIRYRGPSAAMKAFLASDKSSVFESFIWGHEYLGLSAPDLKLHELDRLNYTLVVEDAILKSSATFRADKVRPFSTAELTYVLYNTTGVPQSTGYWSKTKGQAAATIQKLVFEDVAGHSNPGSQSPAQSDASD